MDMTI
jgi:hypothetical protein